MCAVTVDGDAGCAAGFGRRGVAFGGLLLFGVPSLRSAEVGLGLRHFTADSQCSARGCLAGAEKMNCLKISRVCALDDLFVIKSETLMEYGTEEVS
jgi:hypothetical protein